MGYALNHPQNRHPPSQLPDTPSSNELTTNHLFDGFLERIYTPKRITKVKQSALIGSNLTQGACTKIGKITKKDDQILKIIGFDKKVLLSKSISLWNSFFKLSFTTKFFLINSSNESVLNDSLINLNRVLKKYAAYNLKLGILIK